jgi:hypothetical protein
LSNDFEPNKVSFESKCLLTVLNFLIITIDKQLSRLEKDMLELMNDLDFYFEKMKGNIEQAQGCVDQQDLDIESENNLIKEIFNSPQHIIQTILRSIQTSTDQKEGIVSYFNQIDEKVNTERQLAQAFLPVVEAINNLLLLAKIEQARYDLNMASKSDYDVSKLATGNFKELEDIISDYDVFAVQIDEKIKLSSAALSDQQLRYRDIVKKMNHSLNLLDQSSRKVRNDFEQILRQSNELLCDLEFFNGFFASLRTYINGLEEKKSQCLQLGLEIKRKIDTAGGLLPLEQCTTNNKIIQKIIDKCTVDEERITLKEQFSDLSIEESGSGEITLF